MKCMNCNKDLSVTKGQKPKKYCNDSCKMRYFRSKVVTKGEKGLADRMSEELSKKDEEQELRQVEIEGESQNARSAREYREFQKEWIKDACEEYRDNKEGYSKFDDRANCRTCGRPYLRHHEARYVVQHGGLL